MYAVVARHDRSPLPNRHHFYTRGENPDFEQNHGMDLVRPWPSEQKKGSAFRVNVLIDGVRLACSMHRTFFSEACYNETKNNHF